MDFGAGHWFISTKFNTWIEIFSVTITIKKNLKNFKWKSQFCAKLEFGNFCSSNWSEICAAFYFFFVKFMSKTCWDTLYQFFYPKTCLLCLRPSSRSGSSGSLNSGSNRLKNKAYLNDVSFSLIKTDFLLYKHFFGTNEKVKSNRYFFTQKLGKTNRPQKSSKILDLCLHQNYQEVKCTRGRTSKTKQPWNIYQK